MCLVIKLLGALAVLSVLSLVTGADVIQIDRTLELDTPRFLNDNDDRCKWFAFEPFGITPGRDVPACITDNCQTTGSFNLQSCSRDNAADWYVTIGAIQPATYLEYTNRGKRKSYRWQGVSTETQTISYTSNWREQSRSEIENNYCYWHASGGEIEWEDFADAACVRPSQITNLAFTDETGTLPRRCDPCNPDTQGWCLGFPSSQLYYYKWREGILSCQSAGVSTGITAPCLANHKSWSAPVCSFIEESATLDTSGSCITLHWLLSKGLMFQYSTIFYFKFPSDLASKMHLKIFSDSSCKNYKTTYRGSIANDFGVDPAVQISFDSNANFHCKMCPPNYGSDSALFYEKAGVHGCRLCQTPAEYRQTEVGSICSTGYARCVLCDEHMQHDGQECVACPPDKPKRGNFPLDQECTTCNLRSEWFHTGNRQCQPVSTRRLELHQSDPSGVEYYHSNRIDNTDVGYSTIREGYYLDISTGFRAQLPCSAYCTANAFQFAHNCGSQGETVYVVHTTTKAVGLWSDIRLVPGVSAEHYSIKQPGECQSCEECSIGNYNDGCGDNNADGTCLQCLKNDACSDGHYLAHSDDEGCNQTRARSNYACRQCQAWEVDSDNTVWLWVGCGRKTTMTAWKFSGTVSVQQKTCAFEAGDTSADLEICQYRGKSITPRYKMQKFWGQYTMRIPYCPPGYFVDLERLLLERRTTEIYDQNYCSLCATRRVDQRIDESQYRQCDGSTSADTQAPGIVNSCEANRYEDEASGSCKMCESCSEGRM